MGRLDAVRWVDLPTFSDGRGNLTAVEGRQTIPFDIQRVYYLHGLGPDRGGHAHRDTEQIVVAAAGSFELTLSDGAEHRSFKLDNPIRAIYISPMLFIRLSAFSPDARVLVLASTHYDKKRSIWSWEDYLEALS